MAQDQVLYRLKRSPMRGGGSTRRPASMEASALRIPACYSVWTVSRAASALRRLSLARRHEVERLLLFHHDPWYDDRRLEALCTEAAERAAELGGAAWVAFREWMAIRPHGAARRLG